MIKKNMKIFMAPLLLVSMINLHAETLLCPEISIIQQAASKINIATKFHDIYSVYTEDYVFQDNRIYWRVGAKEISASSNEEALQKGKQLVQYTLSKDQQQPIKINSLEFSCTYAPKHIFALGIKL